jgi:hypothetical protein
MARCFALVSTGWLLWQMPKHSFVGVPTANSLANSPMLPHSWPFACWGLDMIGPFTTAPGGFTHVLVAIDKFTKWIEYKAIATLTVDQVVTFICDILYRFGFPNTIITDFGIQFSLTSVFGFL